MALTVLSAIFLVFAVAMLAAAYRFDRVVGHGQPFLIIPAAVCVVLGSVWFVVVGIKLARNGLGL
jgi:hypothetical protein